MGMSMTGYGIDSFHVEGTTITVEIKTVNSRFLDFVPKIPRSFLDIEIEMKQLIQTYFHRGRIELFITLSGEHLAHRTLKVDWQLMDDFFSQINKVKARYQLTGEIPLSIIGTVEELFQIQEEQTNFEHIKPLLIASVKEAAKQVVDNRKSEGRFLLEDISNQVHELEDMLAIVEKRIETVYVHYHQKIKQRIEEHIGQTIEVDQTQLLHEIALLAEKGDVTEEITRLHSHLHHIKKIIEKEGPIGRKLDFISQEMQREVNTIGSKSVDSKINEFVVKMKSSIEKIKEQVQNIE